jgi:hypothetical protein
MSRQAPAVWSVVSARRIVIKLQQRCHIVRCERTNAFAARPDAVDARPEPRRVDVFLSSTAAEAAGRILAMRSRDGNIDAGAHADNRLKIFSSIDSCRCESSRFKNPRVEE